MKKFPPPIKDYQVIMPGEATILINGKRLPIK